MTTNGEDYTDPWVKMLKPFVFFKVINSSDGSPKELLITAVNPAFEAMAGLPQKVLVNSSTLSLVSSSTDEGFNWQALYEALADPENPAQLLDFYNPKNSRYYEVFVCPVQPGFLAAIFLDITDRKKREELLRENELRFQSLVAAMETGLVVEDSNRNIVLINQAFCDFFSILAPPEALIGTNCSDAAEQSKNLLADPELFPRHITEIISKRKLVLGEEILFANGKTYERDYIPVFAIDKSFVGHMWQYRDITTRKEAEAELRKKEELYRAVVEAQRELICRFKPDTTLTFANKAYLDYFGITEKDIGTLKFLDLVPVEEHASIHAHLQKLIVSKKPLPYEHEVIGKDKRRTWQRWTDYPLLEERGKVVEFQSHGYDITEVKEALLKLEASEARLNTLIDKTPTVIYSFSIIEGKPKLNYISENVINILGFKPSDFIENIELWFNCVHPDDLPGLADKLKGHESYDEYRFKDSEGRYHWLADQQKPVKNESGHLEIIGSWWDISERKAAEEELKRLKLFNESIVQNITEGIIISDLEGNVTFANQALLDMLGYTAEEFLGSHWTAVVPAEYHRLVEAADARRLAGKADRYELIFRHKSSALLFLQVSGSPYHDHTSGELAGTVAVLTDISERKKTEEVLKASEERIRLITRNIKDVVVETDVNGYYTYISESGSNLLGYGQELIGKRTFDYIHPDDVEQVLLSFAQTAGSNKTARVEYRFHHPERGYIWVEGAGGTYQNNSNETMVLVTIRDITERKNAEAEIAAKNKILSQLNTFILEQTETKKMGSLIDLILKQLILSTGALGGIYCEYSTEHKALVVKKIKAEQALIDKAITITGKSLVKSPLPVSDRFFKFMTDKVVATFPSLYEATDGAVSKTVAEKINKVFGFKSHIAIAYVIEGQLYGTTALFMTADQAETKEQFLKSFAHVTAVSLRRVRSEDELRYMSLHDRLTGLFNRFFFDGELRRYAGSREFPITIISADFDGLKLINDTLGHSAGDSYLIAGARVLNSVLRSSDILARVGGDEFALLLPRTTREDGEKLVDRIRQSIIAYNQTTEGLPLSISIGLAVCENSDTSLEDTFRSADDAMYQDKFERSINARSAIINFLMTSLHDRDQAAKEIDEQVEKLSVRLGQALTLNESQLSRLELFARVRDLGNITLSGHLLQKSGALTERETELMRQHAETGYRIFSSTPDPELAGLADLVLKHHENFDGTGYPLGLKGDDIPIECRIVAVCAAYCAMINPRTYGRTFTPKEACAELQRFAGTQFDPQLVELFISLVNSEKA